MPRGAAAFLGLVALILLWRGESAAQPPAYSATEIRGWVVDAETKQPLEGVYVVAQWILDTGIVHQRHVTRLHIMETQTDAKGEYYFPAWGPKPRPFMSELDSLDPQVIFFKPGYLLLSRSNQAPHHDPVRTWRWNGKTLEMERFSAKIDEWAFLLGSLQGIVGWGQQVEGVLPRLNDNWRYMPHLALAIWEQRQLIPERLKYLVSDLESWQITEADLRKLVGGEGSSP